MQIKNVVCFVDFVHKRRCKAIERSLAKMKELMETLKKESETNAK